MNPIGVGLAVALFVIASLGSPLQAAPATAPAAGQKVRVLIVTGGHDFEREAFFAVFKAMPDVTYVEAEHPHANSRFAPAETAKYDVVVLYDMWQKITDDEKKNLVTLVQRGKGVVGLHHCLANYQAWPEFEKLLGGKYRLEAEPGWAASTFKHDVDVRVKVAAPKHAILAGLKDFEINDEVYGAFAVRTDVKPLLTTDHPESGRTIAWAHRYGNGRVAYVQLGHGPRAFANENYRKLVHNAVRWAAGRIPQRKPDADGFVSLFNGKNLDGWVVAGDPAGFAVKDGVIRSEGETGGLWLRSVRTYGDFVLRLEWKVSRNGNSGVFIRCTEEGYPWETGSEIQITNEPRDEMHCTGSLYGSVAAHPRPDESADKWHAFEIRCEGPRITILSDGVKTVDADATQVEALAKRPRRGYVGLQDAHATKGNYIEYRNIRIKDLSRDGSAKSAAAK